MDIKHASKLFTKRALSHIANGDPNIASDIWLESGGLLEDISDLKQLFIRAYELMHDHYRNEYILKNEIINSFLLDQHPSDDATLVYECRAGSSKADAVVFNGESICYEVKSKFDSSRRLKSQCEDYLGVFDKTYVVFDAAIEKTIVGSTPLKAGLIRYSENSSFKVIREPSPQEKCQPSMIDMLRIKERVYICEALGIEIPNDIPNTEIGKLTERHLSTAELAEFNSLFISAFKKHRPCEKSWLQELPREIRAASTSLNRTGPIRKRLVEHLS